ncbi:MAG TPA: hypothetical protein DCZ69_16850 [Syntrophobacteraceae bacterium]|nr:hypothetical protein [Syntrophobacteraceae bacterium]HBD09921.1 hypothetical protein [Syntrophobacteraceae bacterium]
MRKHRIKTSGHDIDDLLMKGQHHLYDYHIDAHGNWFCEGNPVVDEELFRILSRSLFEQQGRYFIHCEGEIHPVRVADAPLWVRYVHLRISPEGHLQAVDIELRDGRREPLAADTLSVAHNQGLYCRATRHGLKARFGKVAYYEFTRHLHMDPSGATFYFIIADQRYDVRPELPH